MHVRTGVVAVILAAAAGAAAGRAMAPHGAPVVAVVASPNVEPGWSDGANTRRSASTGPFAADRHDRQASGSRSNLAADAGPATAVVYVAGAVMKPGVYTLRPTARIDEALRAAGGATRQADLVAINLAARVEDGEEIAVPARGAEASVPSGAAHLGTKHSRRHEPKRGRHRKRIEQSDEATDTADAPSEMVDVNAADEATLETLPGVGPSLARRIVAFRDLNGPFASSDELLDVGGMTSGKVDALSPYVTFH